MSKHLTFGYLFVNSLRSSPWLSMLLSMSVRVSNLKPTKGWEKKMTMSSVGRLKGRGFSIWLKWFWVLAAKSGLFVAPLTILETPFWIEMKAETDELTLWLMDMTGASIETHAPIHKITKPGTTGELLDTKFRKIYPAVFGAFNIIYWYTYLTGKWILLFEIN